MSYRLLSYLMHQHGRGRVRRTELVGSTCMIQDFDPISNTIEVSSAVLARKLASN